MAKVISDEILKLKVIVNGDEAQTRILELERANNKYALSLNELNKKQSLLSKQRKKDSEEYRINQKEIAELTKKISDNKIEIDKEVKAMDVLSLTMQQLRKRASDLNYTLSHMNPNSKIYTDTKKELEAVNQRMGELKAGANGSSMSLNNLADKFNHYSGIAAATAATLAGVAVSIQATIDMNNKLADAQTAVAKTTGLTNEEVKELSSSFAEFNTRTSRMDLLKIAEVGGRLGVPKEEIQSFTKEVDKMYVALGDGFEGGAEQVANQLGKIKNLFSGTKDLDMATAYNQIGSALNELGANGAASEANIADFTLRVGALPEKLKPSIAETMALGAAFEESGIDAERAGTAYSSFVRAAAKESGKFAEVMNLSKKEVDELINKDPMQFFLKFAEGTKGLDTTELAQMLDYLKLNDQYVISIMGAASENTDRFRNSINLSNEALTEATSLQEEFDKVNNNSAAIYEKVRKSFIGMFTSETVANTLNWLVNVIAQLIGVADKTSNSIQVFKTVFIETSKIITIITASLISYRFALILAEMWTGKTAIATRIYALVLKFAGLESNRFRAATLLSVAAKALFTGNITRATAAMRLFNLTLKLNPLGLLLSAITLVIGALIYYKNTTEAARLEQKKLFEEQNRYSTLQKQILEQGKIAQDKFRKSTELLINTIKSEIATKEMRKKAYESLIKMHPQFIGTVDREFRATSKLVDVYRRLSVEIDESARAKARASAKQSIYDEIEKDRMEYIKGQSARENEQKERDAYRKKARDRYDLKTSKGRADYKMVSGFVGNAVGFEEHNKGTAIQSKMIANQKLLNQLAVQEKKEMEQLLKLQKSATGEEKKRIETKINRLLNNGETISEEQSNYSLPVGGEGKTGGNEYTSKKERSYKSSATKEESEFDKYLKDMLSKSKSAYDEMGITFDEFEKNKIEIMKDGQEKEIALLDFELRSLRKGINDKIHSTQEYDVLNDAINKTRGKKQEQLIELRENWQASDQRYNEIEIQQIEISEIKKQIVVDKYKADDLRKSEEIFNRKIDLLNREQNTTIAKLTTLEQQKQFLKDKITSEEYLKITTWEEGKAAIEKYYQEQSLIMQSDYLQQLISQLDALPPASLTREQTDALEAMRSKLAEVLKIKTELGNGKSKQQGESLKGFGSNSNDILGISSDQWKDLFAKTDDFQKKIEKVGAAFEIVKNITGTYFNFLKANEDAAIAKAEKAANKKKKALEIQLKSGAINQEEFKQKTLLIEGEIEKKKKEFARRQFKRQQAMQVAETISNTAKAIMGIWADFPKADFGITAGIMSGVVGALGAVQVATIMKQQPPETEGAEDGLYPVIRSQDKKRFNARKRSLSSGLVYEPTILVGEAGINEPEMVIDGKTMKRLKPTTVQMLNEEIAQIRGFENGYYKEKEINNSNNDDVMLRIIDVLNRNTNIMEKIDKDGIVGVFDKGPRTGKELEKSIEEYRKLINKNKR